MSVSPDRYTHDPPSTAATLDLFAGEWSSRLPGSLGALGPGTVPLFEDNRIEWLVDELGGVGGLEVLELGPLEGGHSYMLERAGAASVFAIESNARAYLRCLVVKELLGLTRTQFVFGDAMPWFEGNERSFDLAVASGVLYHMVDPIGLLAHLARVSDRVFLWTHYFDAAVLHSDPALSPKFPDSEPAERDGFRYTRHRQEYLSALQLAGFCGGSEAHSYWLSRDDILGYLAHAGFTDVRVAHEVRDHPNGPAFSVLAQRPAAQPRSVPAAVPLASPPALTVADAEAAVAHYQARIAVLEGDAAAARRELAAVTATRWWRARSLVRRRLARRRPL